MAAAPSRTPPFSTAEYWTDLEAIAEGLVNLTDPHLPRPNGYASR
jgi:hypothetical protein